ncbi:hypothetical protein E1189_00625 [Sansalvadorimonas verongulae]|nr:hypothetical protein [Sansalvadorimonas verongulae]
MPENKAEDIAESIENTGIGEKSCFELQIVSHHGQNVMTSMALAEMCGQTHANFLKKAPKVLDGGRVKFYSSYLNSQNKHQPCLMAVSYSYSYGLQAKIPKVLGGAERKFSSGYVVQLRASRKGFRCGAIG